MQRAMSKILTGVSLLGSLAVGLWPAPGVASSIRCQNVFQSSPQTAHPLTKADIETIKGYTGGQYLFMNSYLRNGLTREQIEEISHQFPGGLRERVSIASVKSLIEKLKSALGRLPPYEGEVYRSLRLPDWVYGPSVYDPVLREYAAGSVITEKAFLSATLLPQGAGNSQGSPIRFRIHGLSGRLIESFSHEPYEREILFLPGTRFEVLRQTAAWEYPKFNEQEMRYFYIRRGLTDRRSTAELREDFRETSQNQSESMREDRLAFIEHFRRDFFSKWTKEEIEAKLDKKGYPVIRIEMRELPAENN